MADGRWFDPYRELIAAAGPPDDDPRAGWLARLNALADARDLRNARGLPLRFEPAGPMPANAYESTIAATGRVPTRLHGQDAWHDYFNALVWLRFPAIKRRLNALQAEAIAAACDPAGERPAGRARGRLRDVLTLFDESAALVLTDDRRCRDDLRGFAWTSLFVERRAAWRQGVRTVVVGHALLLKLWRPYKAVCAQAWLAPAAASLDDADRAVAASLDAGRLLPRCLTPLPVLGVPGWWPANEDAGFYADASVFRAGRRR
ncbi:MAG: DUF3025 domain-containing protein [Burkholderiaceae bacterium]